MFDITGSETVKEDCNDIVQRAVIWGTICALSCLCKMFSQQRAVFPCSFDFVCDEKNQFTPKQHLFCSFKPKTRSLAWLKRWTNFRGVFTILVSVNIWNCTYETIPPGLAVWQCVCRLAVCVTEALCVYLFLRLMISAGKCFVCTVTEMTGL